MSDIRRRRLAEIGHEKKNNKAVFKGVLISKGILMVRVIGNEISTCHDMNYGQVRYPTLVDEIINFTKSEPFFWHLIKKWLDAKKVANEGIF